ncbi:MAG: hypothetical protein QXY75_03015 [Candidatus Bathyarchaeia archaeon]
MEKGKDEVIALGLLGAFFVTGALLPKKVKLPTGETAILAKTTLQTDPETLAKAEREVMVTETGETRIIKLTIKSMDWLPITDELNGKLSYWISLNIEEGVPPFFAKATVRDSIGGTGTATAQANAAGIITLEVSFPLVEGRHEVSITVKVWDSIMGEANAITLTTSGTVEYTGAVVPTGCAALPLTSKPYPLPI